MRISLSGEMKTSKRKIFNAARARATTLVSHRENSFPSNPHVPDETRTWLHPMAAVRRQAANERILTTHRRRHRAVRLAPPRAAPVNTSAYFLLLNFAHQFSGDNRFLPVSRCCPSPVSPRLVVVARELPSRVSRPVRPSDRRPVRSHVVLSGTSDRLVSSVTNRLNECD